MQLTISDGTSTTFNIEGKIILNTNTSTNTQANAQGSYPLPTRFALVLGKRPYTTSLLTTYNSVFAIANMVSEAATPVTLPNVVRVTNVTAASATDGTLCNQSPGFYGGRITTNSATCAYNTSYFGCKGLANMVYNTDVTPNTITCSKTTCAANQILVNGACVCNTLIYKDSPAGGTCNACVDPTYQYVNGVCQKVCSDGWIGTNCQTCDAHYQVINGQCNTCQPNFSGTGCLSCAAGVTGTLCNACTDSVHKQYDGVSRTCVCKGGWGGTDCQSCNPNYALPGCTACKPNWTGTTCNTCATGHSGANCSTCTTLNYTFNPTTSSCVCQSPFSLVNNKCMQYWDPFTTSTTRWVVLDSNGAGIVNSDVLPTVFQDKSADTTLNPTGFQKTWFKPVTTGNSVWYISMNYVSITAGTNGFPIISIEFYLRIRINNAYWAHVRVTRSVQTTKTYTDQMLFWYDIMNTQADGFLTMKMTSNYYEMTVSSTATNNPAAGTLKTTNSGAPTLYLRRYNS